MSAIATKTPSRQSLGDLQQFARAGLVRVDAGPGGLPRLTVTSPQCRVELCTQGAHLCAWEPAGQPPVIWMTGQANFAAGMPIRGGVPICWPWFGPSTDPNLPMHGVVRTREWTVQQIIIDDAGSVTIELFLRSDDISRAAFPHDFTLRYRVIAGRTLTLALHATNTGTAPFKVAEAFHTYLAVGDIRRTSVIGLEHHEYLDRSEAKGYGPPNAPMRCQHGGEPLAFAEEVDRHYLNHRGAITIDDAAWHRTLRVEKRNSASSQVWNPWIEKARRLPDLGDHEWPGLIVVEAANAFDNAYVLAPGESHELITTVIASEMRG